MKTLYTTYNNFAKRVLMSLMLLMTIGVTAVLGEETVTLTDIGATLGTSINSSVNTATVNTYDIYYRYCKKQSNSGLNAMMLDKSHGAFIANKSAMPGKITSVTIYALNGAGTADYHCAFSTIERNTLYTDYGSTKSISGGNSQTYTCSLENARYFCISLGSGSANNGQVWKVEIQYEILTGTKHTVNWYVDGELHSTQTDVAGVALNIPKLTRMNCDAQKVFVGWTTKTKYANATVAPDDLITSTEMSIPVGGANYYAVFATANPGGSNLRTVTLSPPDVENTSYEIGTIDDSEQNTWTYHATIQNQYKVLCFGLNANSKNYNIGSPIFGGYVKSVSFRAYTAGSDRKFYFCSSNSTPQPTSGDLGTVSLTKDKIFATTQTITFAQDVHVQQFYIYANGGSFITDISVTYASNYSNYTTNCTNRTFSITYDANGADGGSVPIDPSSPYDTGTEVTVLGNTGNLAKTGHTFAGWNTQKNGNGTPYSAGNTFTITTDITLYAQWTPNQHTLTWELNGGKVTVAGTNADVNATGTLSGSVNYGTSIQAPQVAKTGYTFTGWSSKVQATMPDNDLTYTAQWTPNTYTVQFNANGGAGAKMVDQTFTYGVSQTLSINTYTKSGHTFAGWATSENGSVAYTDQQSVSNLTAFNNSIVTLYAQWTPKSLTNYRTLCTYDITWLIGEDPYEEGEPTTTVTAGQTISSLPTKPSDSALGCCSDKFMGWTTSTAKTIENQYLYETLGEIQEKFPSIYENLTFRAVFATTAQGVGTSVVDFSEVGYENGTAVTDPIVLGDGEGHGDATITLAKAQSSSNNPTYYNDGEAVRIYAGGTIKIASTYNNATIKNITFAFGTNDGISAITPDKGNYSDGTWTGDAQSVTFTISGSTGHRRIASIQVTTGVTGSQYTNYVTQCTALPSPALSGGSVSPIAVDCGKFSTLNNSQAITFTTMQDLTCPVTFEVTEGDFLISTAKDKAAQYQSKITVTPTKSGSNIGHLKNVYVRANATDHNESFTGKITVTSGEIDAFTINLEANVTCIQYTLKTVDHLGNETVVGNYYAGEIIENAPAAPTPDACSQNYTFDGWSTTSVEYGSLVYNQVSFPYVMPAENVTLIPVYRLLEDVDNADYHRVTSDLGIGDVDGNNWAGDYLIAYSDQIFADGRIGGKNDENSIGKANVRSEDFSKYIKNNVVPASYGNTYYITLESVEDGYLFKTQDGNYNYYSNNSNNDLSVSPNASTAKPYAIKVVFESESDIRLCLSGDAKGSVFRYGCSGNCFFRFYKDCGGNPIYLYKKSPLYTSSLICEEVTASDALVTSTAGQTVKVNVPITLTSSLHRTTDITAESDNTHFTITNLSGIEEGNHTLAVHYRPTVTTDGIETANIKIKVNNLPVNTFQVTGRHLPENFVIATKVGATWYALPADMSSATNPVGVVIEVDETTMTATAPNTTSYTLFPVKTTNTQYDRFAKYGDRVRFSAVNNSYKGLWANNSKTDLTINNDMVIDQASDGQTDSDWANNSYYEWKLTTTVVDGHWQYTLQTDQQYNTNYLRYWTAASGAPKWGTYAAGNNQLYFLPVTETEPFDYQVVEWYPTKMLIQTDATIANPTAKIGDVPINNVTCTNKGGKLYEIAGLPLESNPTKVLTIKFSDGGNNYTNATAIPVIISQSETTVSSAPFTTLTKDVYNYADLVVRDGATLTIDGGTHAENTFFNVTIYPTSKISVPSDKKLTVHSLTFFGGIDEIYNGSTYTLNKYGVPQLSLKGTLGKTIPQIDYIMRVDLDQMYQVGVPYDVNLNEVTYWDGTAITLGSQLYVSTYDGDARAKLDWNNTWRWEVNFTEKILKAGVGYTISAEPQFGETYSILRLPMKNNITSGETEAQKASIVVTAHGMSDENLTDNHKGWNYLSNPYMAAISGAESGGVDNNNIVVGYLVETGKGPWKWKEDSYRYVTIPTDDGTNYSQQKFTEATLKPFKSFFLQIANSGDLSFALASRQNAPARYLQQEAAPREVEFEVLLSNNTQSDNTGLLISEEFSPAYEINADLEKMIGSMSVYTIYNGYNLAYNALSPLNAMEEIPLGYVVPTTGEYTFTLDERGDLEDIEHIYLLDHDSSITTDLMEDIYTFTATEKKNDHRFAISVILKAEEEEETPTHLETLEWESDHPYKFIYQDKMYILRNGVIYDAMGKQVTTINK